MGQRGRPKRGEYDEYEEPQAGGGPRRRRIGAWVVTGVLLATFGVGGYYVYRTVTNALRTEDCTAKTADGSITIANNRMANAATITAVARAEHLPERAAIVALATAQQESKINNLSGGDRDSLGLFQQRPSAGWGSPEQIADPVYASAKFYSVLTRLSSWQTRPVGKAAQAVQKSADSSGDSYQQWESMATILADTLNGQQGASLSCKFDDPKLPTETPGTDGLTPRAAAVGDAVVKQFSANGLGAAPQFSHSADGLTVQITPRSGDDPRVYAYWAVASAKSLGIDHVQYADQMWTRSSGKWQTADKPINGQVDVTVANGT